MTSNSMPVFRRLMDTNEAASYLGLSSGTLRKWRMTGKYNLPHIEVGGRIRYDRNDLDAWLEFRKVGGTKKAG